MSNLSKKNMNIQKILCFLGIHSWSNGEEDIQWNGSFHYNCICCDKKKYTIGDFQNKYTK